MCSEIRKCLIWVHPFGCRSYSECCIDDVNASHAKSNDTIVKFGHSCFSTSSVSKQHPNKRFWYILPQQQDTEWIDSLLENLKGLGTHTVLLYAHTKYYLAMASRVHLLPENVHFGFIDSSKFNLVPKQTSPETQSSTSLLGRVFQG